MPSFGAENAASKLNTDQCYGRGVVMVFYPVLATFGHIIFQWLGVTRASDPPVACGHRLSNSCCCMYNILNDNMKRGG